MDRRALENFVQDVIDSGTNPLTHPELAVHLREHPDLARQAEELWRVDQWMRLCGDSDACVDPAECDGLLDAVMSAVETTPQQPVETKVADNWILRVGLPAAAAATLTLGSLSGVAAAKPMAVPAVPANPSFNGPSFSEPVVGRQPAGYPLFAPATPARANPDRPYPGAGRLPACPPARERSAVRRFVRSPDRPAARRSPAAPASQSPSVSQSPSGRLRSPAFSSVAAHFASAAS